MGRYVTEAEMVQQVCVTAALADESRADRTAYRHWVRVAGVANDRTRLSMLNRGVDMLTFRGRKGGASR